jgi:hypothetical protein
VVISEINVVFRRFRVQIFGWILDYPDSVVFLNPSRQILGLCHKIILDHICIISCSFLKIYHTV